MIRGLVSTVMWLFACAIVGGGLYWALLNTPDSNVLMLAGSALLAVAILLVCAVAVSGAVLLTRNDGWWRGLARSAVIGLPWFVLALVPILLIAWLTGRADAWLMSKSGEISAWFIARFDWVDVSWLVIGAHFVLAWLQWVAGPWLGLTLFAVAVDPARNTAASPERRPTALALRWISSACRWRPLALVTLWFLLLLALPWHLARWRPTGLPPTWIEPALAAARLLVVAALMTIGAALIVRAAVRRPTPAPPPSPAVELVA